MHYKKTLSALLLCLAGLPLVGHAALKPLPPAPDLTATHPEPPMSRTASTPESKHTVRTVALPLFNISSDKGLPTSDVQSVASDVQQVAHTPAIGIEGTPSSAAGNTVKPTSGAGAQGASGVGRVGAGAPASSSQSASSFELATDEPWWSVLWDFIEENLKPILAWGTVVGLIILALRIALRSESAPQKSKTPLPAPGVSSLKACSVEEMVHARRLLLEAPTLFRKTVTADGQAPEGALRVPNKKELLAQLEASMQSATGGPLRVAALNVVDNTVRGFARTAMGFVASVHFKGSLVDEKTRNQVAIDEIWHFEKDANEGPWTLQRIERDSA